MKRNQITFYLEVAPVNPFDPRGKKLHRIVADVEGKKEPIQMGPQSEDPDWVLDCFRRAIKDSVSRTEALMYDRRVANMEGAVEELDRTLLGILQTRLPQIERRFSSLTRKIDVLIARSNIVKNFANDLADRFKRNEDGIGEGRRLWPDMPYEVVNMTDRVASIEMHYNPDQEPATTLNERR